MKHSRCCPKLPATFRAEFGGTTTPPGGGGAETLGEVRTVDVSLQVRVSQAASGNGAQ